jgi:hypothetical protein
MLLDISTQQKAQENVHQGQGFVIAVQTHFGHQNVHHYHPKGEMPVEFVPQRILLVAMNGGARNNQARQDPPQDDQESKPGHQADGALPY